MNELIEILKLNWDLLLIIVALIEMLIRIIPTRKNYSLIDFIRLIMSKIHLIFDKYLPNNRVDE